MDGIAKHMLKLHEKGISHRDLKAANVLLNFDYMTFYYFIYVADFECSIGVLGTGFWRAPEILSNLRNVSTITNEQWKQADVYSFGMTCFEIVTGRIPFDGELENTKADRELVIEDKRPQLPSDLDDAVKDLIMKCWEPTPSSRPTFFEIVDMLETISERLFSWYFRLFDIGDELRPQYRLATVQEVNEYPIALARAMPFRKIANGFTNLANGSVDGSYLGMETRLMEQRDASHKLARFHN